MAYISFQPSDYFNTVTYAGNSSSTQSITGVGFQPDWVWIKQRNLAYSHVLFDAVRGVGKNLSSNSTTAEETNNSVGYLSAFDSDGFTVSQGSSSGDRVNGAYNYVGWNWKANGSGSANTDGSISSTVSANTTAGFSIVKWTGTGSAETIGHGTGQEIKFFIAKKTSASGDNWYAYHGSLGGTKYLHLNNTASAGTASSPFNNTNPTSTTISAGTDLSNSSADYIAYCFAEKKGFSKFSSHVGNGSTDGAFIYTGFKPAWFLLKPSSGSGQWFVWDSTRSPINQAQKILSPESTAVEGDSSGAAVDFVSNGIKIRNSDGGINQSGVTYITMAFAEHPLVSSNDIPATAR